MTQVIKQLVKSTPFYRPLRNLVNKLMRRRQLRAWEANGRPVPPPALVKHRAIHAYAAQYGLKVFVETGTYYGDTVDAVKGLFDEVYSIELSRELHEGAKKRFRSDRQVHLVWGDSGEQIGKLMKEIRRPALFWLDGHYSRGETARGESDTPIYKELTHILQAPDLGHVILIDDAHCFGNDPGYPALDAVRDFVHALRKDVVIAVEDDSIRITPLPKG